MDKNKSKTGLSGCYLRYCKGEQCWGELWALVSEHAKKSLNRLIRKTGAMLTKDDRFDVHNLIVCRVMDRLKEKKRIGKIGGVIYWATSTELDIRETTFRRDCANVELSEEVHYDIEDGHEYDLPLSHNIACYQCEHLGCATMLPSPGYCREHSQKEEGLGVVLSPMTLFTVSRVAIELGLSDRAVWDKLRENEIPSELKQGRRVVRYRDVILYKQQHIADQAIKPTSQVKIPLNPST